MLPPGIALAWVLAHIAFAARRSSKRWLRCRWSCRRSHGLLLLWLRPPRPGRRLLDRSGSRSFHAGGRRAAWHHGAAAAGSHAAAFEQVTRRYEQMAETLGGRGEVFTVTLPLASRNILAGALLGFTRALGEFGATIVVAGSIPGRTRTLADLHLHGNRSGRARGRAARDLRRAGVRRVARRQPAGARRLMETGRARRGARFELRFSLTQGTFRCAGARGHRARVALFGPSGIRQDVDPRGDRRPSHTAAGPNRGARARAVRYGNAYHRAGSRSPRRLCAAGRAAVSAPRRAKNITYAPSPSRPRRRSCPISIDLLGLNSLDGSTGGGTFGRRAPARGSGARALLRARRAAARRAACGCRSGETPADSRRADRDPRRPAGPARVRHALARRGARHSRLRDRAG